MAKNHHIPPPLSLPFLPHRRRQRRCGCAFANRTNTTAYDYDFLGQLVGADYSNTGLTDESYSYDENGNRVTANGDDYTTGDNNELTTDSNWTYTYDDEGNRLTKTNATNRELYEWDYRNRLTKVTQQTYDTVTSTWTTTQIVEYAYDYNNVWVRKLLDTNGDGTADSKSIFIPENYQTVLQLDDTNLSDQSGPTATHHYLWTPQTQDKLLADTTTDGVLWALTDHLGTIRDIIESTPSGLITPAHIIYDAYGNVISCTDSAGTAITNPILFAFTGKAFDADTALQNNINRWYDAAVGRWLSTDPIGFSGNDTNLYRYVGNGVLIFLDTLGKEADPCDKLENIQGPVGVFTISILSVKVSNPQQQLALGPVTTGYKVTYKSGKKIKGSIVLVQAQYFEGLFFGTSPSFDYPSNSPNNNLFQDALYHPYTGLGFPGSIMDSPFNTWWSSNISHATVTAVLRQSYTCTCDPCKKVKKTKETILGSVSFQWNGETKEVIYQGRSYTRGNKFQANAVMPDTYAWNEAAEARQEELDNIKE